MMVSECVLQVVISLGCSIMAMLYSIFMIPDQFLVGFIGFYLTYLHCDG